MTRIEQLKAAFEAVEPGTWYADDNRTAMAYAGWELCDVSAVPVRVFAVAMPEAEAKFIALAHNMMPTLLDTLAAIKARIDGEFDHPALAKIGPLFVDPVADITRILKNLETNHDQD